MTTGSNFVGSLSSASSHPDYYAALCRAALTISSSLELHQVLQSVVQSTSEAMRVKACGLRLLDPSTGQLLISAVYGLSGGYLAKGPVSIEQSPLDSEALQGSPVIVEDACTDPRFHYHDAAKQEGIVSVLCVPLEVRGEAIGVMRVYTDKPTTFEQSDIQFLTVLASLAALAIDNARLYESVRSSFNGLMDAFWGMKVTL